MTRLRHDRIIPLDKLNAYPQSPSLDLLLYLPPDPESRRRVWALALEDYDELKGIDWSWQSMDGAMTKAPLDGGKSGPNPTDRAKDGVKRRLLTESRLAWRLTGPTGTIASWSRRHWRGFR